MEHYDLNESIKEAAKAFEESEAREEIIQIPLELIGPNRKQPRKFFDQAQMQELANSIKERGVIEPIIVRKNNDPSYGFQYEIIAGERRWRAAKIAGLTKIRAIISDANDLDAETDALVENLLRADLKFWEVMLALVSLREKFDNIDTLARAIGKSKRTILEYLSFHKKIFSDEKIAALFSKHSNDVTYSTASLFSSIADKLISHIKRDRREYERLCRRAEKKGIEAAIRQFANKLEGNNRQYPRDESISLAKETNTHFVLTIKISKNTPLTQEHLDNITEGINTLLTYLKNTSNTTISTPSEFRLVMDSINTTEGGDAYSN